MSYFVKFRKDKAFRKQVIVGAVLIFFVMNVLGGQPAQTQATVEFCNQFNTNDLFNISFITNMNGYDSCIANGCAGQLSGNPYSILSLNPINWFNAILASFTAKCVPLAKTDSYVLANSDSEANNQCMSGLAYPKGSILGAPDPYQCIMNNPDNLCKSWQKPFAGILDSFWKKNDMACSTKAYMVMGIGVVAILAVL